VTLAEGLGPPRRVCSYPHWTASWHSPLEAAPALARRNFRIKVLPLKLFYSRTRTVSGVRVNPRASWHSPLEAAPALARRNCRIKVCWPLQDVPSFQSFLALVNHPLIAPSICIAHTIAILLHAKCAIYDSHPTLLVYAIHHTILAVAISCKGQTVLPLLVYTPIRTVETDLRGRTVVESKASDGVQYAGARIGVGRQVTERYETKVIRVYRWVQVFFLLQKHSKHPREMVITPKVSTSFFVLRIRFCCSVARPLLTHGLR